MFHIEKGDIVKTTYGDIYKITQTSQNFIWGIDCSNSTNFLVGRKWLESKIMEVFYNV